MLFTGYYLNGKICYPSTCELPNRNQALHLQSKSRTDETNW